MININKINESIAKHVKKTAIARYSGICRACQRDIYIGDEIRTTLIDNSCKNWWIHVKCPLDRKRHEYKAYYSKDPIYGYSMYSGLDTDDMMDWGPPEEF